jgi:hypothetical protein
VIEFTVAMLSSKINNIEDVLWLSVSTTMMMKEYPGYVAQLDEDIKLNSYSLVLNRPGANTSSSFAMGQI